MPDDTFKDSGGSGSAEGADKGDAVGSAKGGKNSDVSGSAEGAKDSDASGSAEGDGEGSAEGASSDAEGAAAPAAEGGAEGSGNGASVPTAVDGTEGASGSAGDSRKDSGTSVAVDSETDASAPAAEGDSDSDPEAAPVPASKAAGDHASAAEDDSESAAKNASKATAAPDAKGTSDAAKDIPAAKTDSAAKDDSETDAKNAGKATAAPDTKDDSESAAEGAGAAAVPASEGTLGSADDAPATAVPAAKEAPGSAEDDDSTSGSVDDAPAAGTDSAVKGDSGSADGSGKATGTTAAKGTAVTAPTGDAASAPKGTSSSAKDAEGTAGSVKGSPAAKGDSESAPHGTAVTTPDGDSASAPKGTSSSAEGTAGSAEGPAAKSTATAAPKGAPGSLKGSPAAKGDSESAPKGDEDGADGAPEGSAKGTPLPAPRGDAKGPGKAVDTPTTALKSPAAKKPQVDQPTTMLKVGGKAKPAAAEQEAERTSKFVALKPDLKGPSPRVEETRAVPQVGPERTTQQPLPPKPPLDLLAELTNTPPPPETPVRTLVRRVKIWTPLVILLVVILGVVQAMRPLPQPTLALTAKDSFTFEGGKPDIPWPTDGQAALDVQGIGSFGSSGSGKPVPIASVAKVMTAYLILRDHPLKSGAEGPKISIDKAAQDQSKAGQESTVDVTKGDKITQREALEGVLIASANNVARLLARWDAGSEKAFVAKMNAAAKGLGMSGTTYTDPSGLTNSTVSTAADQVKLAKAAMTQPAFREVAAMMSYTDYKGTYHSNWNQLVGHNNVVGIKTGTTTSALGNLVFAAKQDVGGETRMVIGAVLRQPPGGRENTILSAALDHSDALIRAAQGALKSETVLKKGTVVGYVDDGLGGETPVEVTEDVKAAGWAGLKVRLSFTSGTIPHTAKAGTQVGSLTVGDGSSAGAVKVPVALRADLAEPGLGAKLTRIG
ncbi:D-alanyl-D-alanine carboxypeptidase [Streptomyces bauhiniae]|uniref:D-alanyl-D-alanine carboxypeptidase n=1 Tax=Streptomyces bauhiniae TaxID=2340725 RepID=UPI001FCA720D|nr:D-alanyl-D-alanine carboxypeptidase [Streptomyces bauhiniae]